MPCVKTQVSAWLEQDFLDWQASEREKKTREEHAGLFGVSLSTYNNWLHKGKLPSADNVKAIASKRGPGIYDAMGWPRPNPLLQIVIDGWDVLENGLQEKIAEMVANAQQRGATKDSHSRVGKSKRN